MLKPFIFSVLVTALVSAKNCDKTSECDQSCRQMVTCITSVDVEAYQKCFPELEVLDVSNCNVTTFGDEYKNATLPSLTHLNLSGNALPTVSAGDFTGFISLTNINLSFNVMTSLAWGVFSGLKKLKVLDLSNNLLTTLSPDNIKKCCSGISVLSLNNNNLWNVSSLRTFSKLQKLDIANNSQLLPTTLPLQQLPNLIDLVMSNANLTNVYDLLIFKTAMELRKLSIARNSFVELDLREFPRLANLEHLNLLELTTVGHLHLKSRFPALQYLKISTSNWTCEFWDVMTTYLAESNITWLERTTKPTDCPKIYQLGLEIWYLLACIWTATLLVVIGLAWGIHKLMLATPTEEQT